MSGSLYQNETAQSFEYFSQPKVAGLIYDWMCLGIRGADPSFCVGKNGEYYLILQTPDGGDVNSGITSIRFWSGATVVELFANLRNPPKYLYTEDSGIPAYLTWAPEIFFHRATSEYQLLVSACANNNNADHRILHGVAPAMEGPYTFRLPIDVKANEDEDRWAIDCTMVEIPDPISGNATQKYAIWSGWPQKDSGFPQNIYAARVNADGSFGPRRLIAEPLYDWCKTDLGSLLEGPQALHINGEFFGFLVASNASWNNNYCTGILWYLGGDPLDKSSWYLDPEPLLPPGIGIGHGMLIPDDDPETVSFLAHAILIEGGGWLEREIVLLKLFKAEILRRRELALAACKN